ncbi:F-box domain-containing protein [Mycena sanguinolenta]|uniref:F-box domain-containing protein n=1 Tax=Mycena sanguinolenta TaxID=230812 RepID=A0A8H6ZF61_9AGAR|nr:F-box domain-containing protein [Mycena sanguinolenta]
MELPTELIHTISGHLELRDQLFLCRTSHRLYAICVKWIYRVLDLKSPLQLVQCCKTIIARPDAALSVWKLKIECVLSYTLKSFYTTLRSAATRMENLRVISICSPHLFGSISDTVFPRLTDCTIPLLLDSADSYSFLRRNPTIEFTILMPDPGQFISNNLYHIQPIHMPRLRHFIGSEIAACNLVPGSPVSKIGIGWSPNSPIGYSRGLSAVASSTAEICDLTAVIPSWDPALLSAIAQHTPRIQFLKIWAPRLSGLTPEKEDFLAAMDTNLCSLTRLTNLTVADKTFLDRIADALESEFDRVRRWGDICPTLNRVCLSGKPTAWFRWKGLWLPTNCFTDDPESDECLQWFIKKVVLSPELPSDYHDLGEYFAGAAGMEILTEAARKGEALPTFHVLRKEGGGPVISFPSNS